MQTAVKYRHFCAGFAGFYVLSRCACLGIEVFRLLGWQKIILNHSKSRVDYLANLRNRPAARPNPQAVEKHLLRKDILEAVEQQQYDFFGYKKPDVIVMDSFSELTDQLFEHEQGWQFLAHYSDINHTETFEKSFKCKGLLDINDIAASYEVFFDKLQTAYPGTPIVFLHFPTTLDNRDKFKERGKKISEALRNMSRKFTNLYEFHVPDEMVGRPEKCSDESLKDFPYHYNKKVYMSLAREIKSLGIRYPWHCRLIDKITKWKPMHKTLMGPASSCF